MSQGYSYILFHTSYMNQSPVNSGNVDTWYYHIKIESQSAMWITTSKNTEQSTPTKMLP